MPTNSIILVVLYSLGTLQGIVSGILLWRKDTQGSPAAKLIAVLMFLFAY